MTNRLPLRKNNLTRFDSFPRSFSSDPFMPSQKPCFKTVSHLNDHYRAWSVLTVALNIAALTSLMAKNSSMALGLCCTGLALLILLFSWAAPLFKITFLICLPYRIILGCIKTVFTALTFIFWAGYSFIRPYSGKKGLVSFNNDDMGFDDPYFFYDFHIFLCETLTFISEKKAWFIVPGLSVTALFILLITMLPESSSISTFVYNLSTATR